MLLHLKLYKRKKKSFAVHGKSKQFYIKLDKLNGLQEDVEFHQI